MLYKQTYLDGAVLLFWQIHLHYAVQVPKKVTFATEAGVKLLYLLLGQALSLVGRWCLIHLFLK